MKKKYKWESPLKDFTVASFNWQKVRTSTDSLLTFILENLSYTIEFLFELLNSITISAKKFLNCRDPSGKGNRGCFCSKEVFNTGDIARRLIALQEHSNKKFLFSNVRILETEASTLGTSLSVSDNFQVSNSTSEIHQFMSNFET